MATPDDRDRHSGPYRRVWRQSSVISRRGNSPAMPGDAVVGGGAPALLRGGLEDPTWRRCACRRRRRSLPPERHHYQGGTRAMTQVEATDLRIEARRWVRKKRILYTIIGIYGVLSIMWFAIDMADGTENLWFYWPMLGTGIAVAIVAVALLGIGGLFGVGWEQRQIERYVRQRWQQQRST